MDCDKIVEFNYDITSFTKEIPVSRLQSSIVHTTFDEILATRWEKSEDSGCFRYSIAKNNDIPSKLVYAEQYNTQFYVQLNIKRGMERRKPQHFSSVKQEFSASVFNFSKLQSTEILIQLKRSEGKENLDCGVISVNISPIVKYHCLYIPSPLMEAPQVVTFESIRTCLELMYVSGDPGLLIGFNSLCSGASVNHLHYHLYYLQQLLDISSTPLTHLIGDLYESCDFVSGGFVILNKQQSTIATCARNIFAITSFLHNNELAHNICLIRGSDNTDNQLGTVRVFIWPRKPVIGAKVQCPEDTFIVALCELMGHLPIENVDVYESITGEKIVTTIRNILYSEKELGSIRAKIISSVT